MGIIISETKPVIVRFTIDGYTDALHFTDEADRAQYSEEEIALMCQARYDAWRSVIDAPPRESSPEEQAAQIEALREQQQILELQLLALGG